MLDNTLEKGKALSNKEGAISNIQMLERDDGVVWKYMADVQGTNRRYMPSISRTGRIQCGCESGYWDPDTPCYHIYALAYSLPDIHKTKAIKYIRKDSVDESMGSARKEILQEKYIESTVDALNDMFGIQEDGETIAGGIPRETIVQLFGQPQSGKSIMMYQMGYDVMRNLGKGSNMLILDTEGGEVSWYSWKENFDRRFGMKKNDDESITEIVDVKQRYPDNGHPKLSCSPSGDADHNIYHLDVRTLERITRLVGKSAVINVSDDKKAKIETPHEHVNAQESTLGQFINKQGIDYVMFDSFTMPTEAMRSSQRKDRPARHNVQMWILQQFQAYASQNGITLLSSTHESKDKTNPKNPADAVGGKSIAHNTNFMVRIRHSGTPQSKYPDKRTLKLHRHPHRKPKENEYYLDLGDGGYRDITKEERERKR